MIPRLLLALFFLGAFSSSSAAELRGEDAAAIRAVVTAQLDAFARDDGPAAFLLATTGIRTQFGTPEAFMNMVRTEYPVVYRPRSVEFDAPVVLEGEVFQPVMMTDAEGGLWIALYPMERQPDGAWLVNGCELARVTGRQV